MANLSINLLPDTMTADKKQRAKAATLVQISVVILVLIFVASGIILSFRFAQAAQLSKLQGQVTAVKNQISSPDNTKREGLLVTLKGRLDSINNINNQSYPAEYAYALISQMMPPGSSVVDFSVDKKGKAVLQITTPDTASLQQFLNSLTDPQENNQKVSNPSVQSISINKGNTYATGIDFTLAGGAK